jgi:hypothetical protein
MITTCENVQSPRFSDFRAVGMLLAPELVQRRDCQATWRWKQRGNAAGIGYFMRTRKFLGSTSRYSI